MSRRASQLSGHGGPEVAGRNKNGIREDGLKRI
jgi:hypothetical protein